MDPIALFFALSPAACINDRSISPAVEMRSPSIRRLGETDLLDGPTLDLGVYPASLGGGVGGLNPASGSGENSSPRCFLSQSSLAFAIWAAKSPS